MLNDNSIRERIKYIEIQGHTDNIGANDYNIRLSQRRADAVLELMRSKVPDFGNQYSLYFKAVGSGDKSPVGDNNTEEGRAKNRRISFDVRLNEENK